MRAADHWGRADRRGWTRNDSKARMGSELLISQKRSGCGTHVKQLAVMKGTKTFIEAFARRNSINAAIARASVYRGNVSAIRRKNFRDDLGLQLRRLSKKYGTPVADKVHTNRIGQIAAILSRRHKSSLRGGKLKLGVAQKAANLYLKYLWCLGETEMPPHCPFDRGVITRVGGAGRITPWTRLDDTKEYLALVSKARATAHDEGHSSIAEWELSLFNADIN